MPDITEPAIVIQNGPDDHPFGTTVTYLLNVFGWPLGAGDFSFNPFFESMKGDLIWDGSGSGNCWSGNTFTPTAASAQLPACK